MANRWKGNIVSANATTSDGTNYTGKANGAWGLNSQIQQKQANLWAKSVGNPTAPTIGTATAGNANASVSFTASSDAGASGSLTYTAISTPGSFTNTGSSSPITVSGLTNGTQYTFVVNATNSLGFVSPNSAASNSTGTTVPGAPTIGTATTTASQTAQITFTPPANTGGLTITGYTATSSPGSITGTAASSPITVSGLTNGTAYTFTVVATNAAGNSLPSSASNSVTPTASVPAIITGDNSLPGAQAFSWNNGLGTKYTANPSTLTDYSGVCFSSQTSVGIPSSLVAIASSASSLSGTKGIYVYNWGSGFGTKYTDLTSTGLEIQNIKFTPDNSAILASNGYTSPYIVAFAWNNGFGSKFADPSTLPSSGTSRSIDISLDGSLAIMSSSVSPRVFVYPWSVSGFGTKYANPATLPPDASWGVTISRTKNYIAVCNNYTGIGVYAWSNGFGTKYADPTVIGTLDSNRFAKFTANDGAIIANNGILNYAIAWSSSGFGTKYADASGKATTNFASPIAISRENANLVAVVNTVSPFMQVFPWSNATGWGSVYANPSTLPGANSAYNIDFNF